MKISLLFILVATLGAVSAKESGLIAEEKYLWRDLIGDVDLNVCWLQAGDVVNIQDNVIGGDLGNHDVRFI